MGEAELTGRVVQSRCAKVIVELSNKILTGGVLLHGRFRMRYLQFLNESRHVDGLDRQIEYPTPFAPVRKSARRFVINASRIFIANVCSERFPEAL